MLRFFTLIIYFRLVILSLAQNVTIDDTNKAITYDPPNAWTQLKSEDTRNRYVWTTSYTDIVNATATFRFKGTGIWWMTYGLSTNSSTTVTLDGTIHTVSLYTGMDQPQAVLWGQNNLSLDQEHTVVVNNPFGSPINVDAFIVEQFVPSPADILSRRSGEQSTSNSKGGDSSGLIAVLTISAFIVGMLFAFLVCYIHRSRNGNNLGSRSRDDSSTILPFISPPGRSATTPSSHTSPQVAIPWEPDYQAEGRDRVQDLGSGFASRSRWRQRVSRVLVPGSRSAASNWRSSVSGTLMSESNFSSEEPSSPTSLLSPSGMTISSHFYAPSTMPSVGRPRTRDG